MKEDFLHYVWKLKNFRTTDLNTSTGAPVTVFSVGVHNPNAGPDFLNARIKIGDQLWAGNVEIHVKSSDWYLHGHEKDSNYDTVILHVVWEDDIEVFRSSNSPIPALVMKEIVSGAVVKNYRELFGKDRAFINCEKDMTSVADLLLNNWLERMYFERLEVKSEHIFRELSDAKNDWEGVLFRLLMKNFGLNVNGDAFYSVAKAVDYSVVRKLSADPFQLEALLFGLAGLLDEPSEDCYKTRLREEYRYIKHKFGLSDEGVIRPKFSRLRPANFPSIRLSQLACLYAAQRHLFSGVMAATEPEAFYKLFEVKTSPYWTTHYTFGKTTSKREKKLTERFMQLLIINTVLPLKFCYATYTGQDCTDELFHIVRSLKPEDNSVIRNYSALSVSIPSAMESQALLQLYTSYCSKQQCLRCAVGNSLLYSNGKSYKKAPENI